MCEQDYESARQVLLSRLLSAVKGCQVRFSIGPAGVGSSRRQLATDSEDQSAPDGSNREVTELLMVLEDVFCHGLKQVQDGNTSGKVGRRLTEFVSDIVSTENKQCPSPNFWPVVKAIAGKRELDRFYLLSKVTTDSGRSRAWLRAALNEHSLEKAFLQLMADDRAAVRRFYHDWSFLADAQRSRILTNTISGLQSVVFALRLDLEMLNSDGYRETQDHHLATATKETKSSTEKTLSDSSTSHSKHKKKRRVPANTVSLDGEDAAIEDDQLEEAGGSTTPPSRRLELDFGDIKLSDGGNATSKKHLLAQQEDSQSLRSGASAVSGDIDSDEHSTTNTRESGVGRLTPLRNLSVGALIPWRGAGSTADPGENEEVRNANEQSEEDSLSVSESDYASAFGVTPANSKAGSMLGFKPHAKSTLPAPSYSVQSSTSGGVTREELKKALLSVMERKDELHEQCESLKKMLAKESESAQVLRQEADDQRRKTQEEAEKLRSKIQSLSRENDLLKHQLKKYVGAVQKLRDGPQAYETLAMLDQKNKDEQGRGGSRYVDYHYEASEYEKKLIQVAEMHGELIEFNEHLQKSLQHKDAVIRRIRKELEELRGPLPESEATEDAASIGSGQRLEGDPAEEDDKVTAPPLLHIWVPSVFLSGAPGKAHHVYQVYLRIREEEWNIYRRYRDFYELHKELKRQEPTVGTFDFPPKKTVGNRTEKVVEDRRKRLQAYLRQIVNLLVQTNPSLVTRPTKENITQLLPFLGESNRARHSTRGAGVEAGAGAQRGGDRWRRTQTSSSVGGDKRRSRSQGGSGGGRIGIFSRQRQSMGAAGVQLAL